MGTNYFLIPNHENWQVKRNKFISEITNLVSLNSEIYNKIKLLDTVETFISETRIHLGKKSCGWKFAFNANEFKYFNNKETFQQFIRKGSIINEYGEILNIEQFENICLNEKSDNKSHKNYSELKVHVIDNLDFLTYENFS